MALCGCLANRFKKVNSFGINFSRYLMKFLTNLVPLRLESDESESSRQLHNDMRVRLN